MAELVWDAIGDRIYFTGVDRGVIYPLIGPGVPWNGLAAVNEKEVIATQSIQFIDGQAVVNQLGLSDFAVTIEAYTTPTEFDSMFWGQGRRQQFNFSYRTLIGSDVDQNGSYLLHLVYNCQAKLSDSTYASVDNSTDPINFSWDLSTIPVSVLEASPSSHFIVDSRLVYPAAIQELEALLYGSEDGTPSFPTIDELIEIFERNSILRIIDYGDGTWSATGPDSMISMLDSSTFQIVTPSAEYISSDTYKIWSL